MDLKINNNLINYDVYVMGRQEKIRYALLAAGVLFLLSFVFFQSLIISLIFSLGGLYYPRYKCRDLTVQRKKELSLQFKNALYSLSSALGVGKSLESAFKSSLNDLKIIYPNEDAYIIREFEYICRRIEMNEPVEKALADLSKRSQIEDIINFTDVIAICIRTGGNLVEVVKNTSNIIRDKIETEHEIDMILSGKKYEQKLLNIMPVVFIALINLGSSGYTDTLYKSAGGYLLMAAALLILVASYAISKKILDIKV
ncbi:MAG: type II secretion system F family protein [Bacillota bacterium]